jgi:lactaldehyde dehydrogenase/glycolaldehyde dehydrogenase
VLEDFRSLFSEGRPLAARMFIDGRWQEPGGLGVDEVEDPATGRAIATTPAGTRAHAEEALAAARAAQPAWARLPAVERGRAVLALADAVHAESELLARIVVAEQGKPIGQARGEIGATETFLRYAAEWARRIEGEILPSDSENEEIWIRRLPHGVVAGLTAWNYPSALATRKLGPALVAGNTFVLKAHEFTPLSGLALAALAERVGLPKGLFNVVTATGATWRGPGRGRRHDHHDRLHAGGARDLRDGRQGHQEPAAGARRQGALHRHGGRGHRRAVDAAVAARFTNCGQICTCNERMYLHEAIADEFLERFVPKSKALSIGPGMDDPDLGPKISGGEVEKVEAMTAASIEAGAEVLLRGRPLKEGRYEHGHFMAPTVLEVRSNDVPVMQDEVFGPVVAAKRVGSYEEALGYANDSAYGLSAYVWSANLKRVFQAAEGLNFGEIYCNRTNGELVQGFHTGWGLSGLGGEDGKHGFDGISARRPCT